MTTPPRLRLVHGNSPQEREDAPDSTIDAVFADETAGEPAAARSAAALEAAAAAARAARRATIARQAVAGLIGFQLLACLRYLHWYASMLREGAVSPLALLAIPASLGLYVAAGLLVSRRATAACRTLFIVAAMGLAFSVPFWGIAESWTWPFELGATLALAGAWHARPRLAAAAGPQP
jgi:hypothetical protein